MPWKTVRVRSVSKAWPYVNLCMHAYVYFAICLTTALTPYPTEFGMLIGGQWESVIGSTDSDGTLPTLQQRWNEALLRCMLTRHMENWSKRGFQARGLVQNQSSRGMGDEDDELIVVPRSRMQQDDGFTSSSIKKAGWLYYQIPFSSLLIRLATNLSCAAPLPAKGRQSGAASGRGHPAVVSASEVGAKGRQQPIIAAGRGHPADSSKRSGTSCPIILTTEYQPSNFLVCIHSQHSCTVACAETCPLR